MKADSTYYAARAAEQELREKEAAARAAELAKAQYYKIRSGDTLGSIAVKMIFFLKSSIFHAFLNVSNTLFYLCLSACFFDFLFCRCRESFKLNSHRLLFKEKIICALCFTH